MAAMILLEFFEPSLVEITHVEAKAPPCFTRDLVLLKAGECIVHRLQVEQFPTRETNPCTEPPP